MQCMFCKSRKDAEAMRQERKKLEVEGLFRVDSFFYFPDMRDKRLILFVLCGRKEMWYDKKRKGQEQEER